MVKKARNLFSEVETNSLAEEIRLAELKTSGEIVVVVADQSATYGRGAGLFGSLGAALSARAAYGLHPSPWAIPGVVLISYQLFTLLAENLPILKLAFTDKREILKQVERSAAIAYQRFRVARTVHSSGVLIYISLLERRVRVLGDGAIANKLEEKDWKAVCNFVTQGLRAGVPSDGLTKAIQAAGALLGMHFPPKLGDKNELPNTLNIVDGIP